MESEPERIPGRPREAELKGEVETRKEKPEETGSRRSECGSASEGTARSGEKPRRTDGDEGMKVQASESLRKISVSFSRIARKHTRGISSAGRARALQA